MKRIVRVAALLSCTIGAAVASSAAPPNSGVKTSGSYVPALGYVTSGGRGLALYLANQDGSAGQLAYRFASGAQYDLTAASQHLIAVADSHSILMLSWSLNGSTLVTSTPMVIFATSGGIYGDSPAFSPDGTKLAYYTSDGFTHIINASTRQEFVRFPTEFADEINWMPDGNSIVIRADTEVNGAPASQLIEYPALGGPGTVLLTEPNVANFDTSRIPGDRNLLVAYSLPDGQSFHVGIYDPTSQTFTTNLRLSGFQVNWNCPMTKFAYHTAANNGPTLFSYDYATGNSTVIYNGQQGRFPRFLKCDIAALTTNALRMRGGRH